MEHGTVKGRVLTEATMRVQSPSLTGDSRPWCLVVVAGNLLGQRFELGDAMVIGRDSAADIQLAEISVSRRHCHIYRKRGGYWVTDLGATNPTRVNGMQITSTPILDGDLLRTGDLDLKLLGPKNPDNPLPAYGPDFSTRDAITGLVARSWFRSATEAAFVESRSGTNLSLIVLDIDYFKHVNDRFGQAAGQRMLAAIGKILRDQCRGNELAGRIGGAEFAILLPGTIKADAQRFAERLRLSLAALQLMEDGEPVMITASFGVAGARSTDSGPDVLYGRADAALYEAKRLGRNRVVSFPDG